MIRSAMPVILICVVMMAVTAQAATVTLRAGKTVNVGEVKTANDGANLYVTFSVDAPWVLVESHVHVATSLAVIPQKNGNPLPGRFTYSEDDGECVIPLGDWDAGTLLYIAAHAIVRKSGTVAQETAWGDGPDFPGRNWATYFTYTVQPSIDVVLIYPDGTDYPSISLESGKAYRIVANGTYRFGNWGEYGIADAQFNYRDSAHAPSGVAGWYEFPSLQVRIGGSLVDWQPPAFNPEHVYALDVVGAGAPLVFSIIDNQYGDNSGFIMIEIYELP